MENKKKIDDLFKNELGSYTETPPSSVWDALEKRLDDTPSRKPRGPLTWFGYIAIVAVLVAISFTVAKNIGSIDNTAPQNALGTNNTSTEKKTASIETTHANITAKIDDNNRKEYHKETDAPNGVTPNANTNNKSKDIAGNETENGSSSKPNSQTGNGQNNRTALTDPVSRSKSRSALSNNNQKHHHNSSAIYAANTNRIKPNEDPSETGIKQQYNTYNVGPNNSEESTESKPNGNKPAMDAPARKKDSTILKNQNKDDYTKKDKKPKPKFTRFEAGIKGGYEQGFDNDAAKKAVLSPYIQYKITSRFAIMLQPSVKSASLGSRVIGTPGNYYNVNKDGNTTVSTDSIPIHVISENLTLWKWNYIYSETHDSIVKTNVTGGTYFEFEIPVLIKYYISKDFSVYGGVNIIYSNVVGLKENTYISRPITRAKDTILFGNAYSPPPATPQALTQISYTGTEYSKYTGPQYPAPQGGLLRFGYMLGFSYEYNKRWLFDALVQQGLVNPKTQGGYNINTPLSAPYIRLTIGYKIIK